MNRPIFIGVTGAHGVGKSTIAAKITEQLKAAGTCPVTLLDGLGDSIRAMGIPVGSGSNDDTVAAVFSAHLRRERGSREGLVILDRCALDAIAYARFLSPLGSIRAALYEEIGLYQARGLSGVIHCEMSPFFHDKGENHETPELRTFVAKTIADLVAATEVPSISLDASDTKSLTTALTFINGIKE